MTTIASLAPVAASNLGINASACGRRQTIPACALIGFALVVDCGEPQCGAERTQANNCMGRNYGDDGASRVRTYVAAIT